VVQVPVQGGEWDCRGYIELNRARNGWREWWRWMISPLSEWYRYFRFVVVGVVFAVIYCILLVFSMVIQCSRVVE
jgi:hypothetical protein